MEITKSLIDNCKDLYPRALTKLNDYSLSLGLDKPVGDCIFLSLVGILHSFFESYSIIISVRPFDINKSDSGVLCEWGYCIFIDGVEIKERDFDSRTHAEIVAFTKAFQFLDTKLFMELTEGRFIDDSSVVSCLNMNWKHFDKVINYKRKNLLTQNDTRKSGQ